MFRSDELEFEGPRLMLRSTRVIIHGDAFVRRRAGVVFRSDALEIGRTRLMSRGDRVIIERDVVATRGAGVVRRAARFKSRGLR